MTGSSRLFLAFSLLTLASVAALRAQDNPMAPPAAPLVEPEPDDDKAPEPQFPTVTAPLPPVRPGRRTVAPAPVETKAPAQAEAPAEIVPPKEEPASGFSFRLPSFAVEPAPSPQPAPSAAPVPAYPSVSAPFPPVRPGRGAQPAPRGDAAGEAAGAPAASALAPSVPSISPGVPGIPSVATPAAPEMETEGEIETGPTMRLPTIAVQPQASTIEEIEAEESKTPEPAQVEKQTEYVNIACLQPDVLKYIRLAGEHFKGTPVITSGQRDRGRRGSYHRRCMAADFFVPGVERAVLAKYLRSLPGAGGVGTYCHTKAVHIDIGEPRNWYQCGFRFRFAQR